MANATFETALAAIIGGVIFVFFVLPSLNNLLSTRDFNAFDDFNKGLSKMGTLTKYHSTFNLYDNQFIVGFPEGSSKIEMSNQDTYINRPPNCPDDVSCICMCKDTKYDLDDLDEGEIKCPGYMCKSYEVDFNDNINEKDFFGKAYKDIGEEIGDFNGGFFVFKRYNDLYLVQPLDMKFYRLNDKIYFSLNPEYSPRKEKNG